MTMMKYMKKDIFHAAFVLAAITLMGLGSCTSIDQDDAGSVMSTNDVPVTLDAYTGRTPGSRSGEIGTLVNNESLASGEVSLRTAGFGVFSYYHDGTKYSQNSLPDFMWNEKVTYELGHWTYSPVKYWPNEPDADPASGDSCSLSFFAYAPYVNAKPNTGFVDDDSYGITGLSRNSKAGDPIVGYRCSLAPQADVDLCWGVCDKINWGALNETGVQQINATAGLPWTNVIRPKLATGQYLTFGFHHALSQLNVQIDADPDVLDHGDGAPALGDDTKIYLRSVSFMGFSLTGKLNLNNTVASTALWLNDQETDIIDGAKTVTIHDGRLNGLEGIAAAGTGAENFLGLNASLISDNGNTTSGVTASPANLFASDELTAPVLVIPNGAPLAVTVTYDVETADPALKGQLLSDNVTYGTRSHNRITKQIFLNDDYLTLENGKSYTLKLHLGLASVGFEASLGDWTDYGTQSYLAPDMELTLSYSVPSIVRTYNDAGFSTPFINPLTHNVDPSIGSVTYTSSNTNVATVNASTGEVTLKNSGTTTITARFGDLSATYTITVNPAAASLSYATSSYSVQLSDSSFPKVPQAVTNSGNGVVTYTSSDPSVATVDATTGEVTLVAAGTATITATAAEDPNHTYSSNTASYTLNIIDFTMSDNPLWKVAQYNIAGNLRTFETSHSTNNQYLYIGSDRFLTSIGNYHTPSENEFSSIFINTPNLINYNADTYPEIKTTTTSGYSVYSNRVSRNDIYMIRYIENEHVSVWHYKYITSPCNGWLIESYLLPNSTTAADAQSLISELPSSSMFTGTLGASNANQTPESTTLTPNAFCQRFFPLCGYTSPSFFDIQNPSQASSSQGSYGSYFTTTNYNSNSWWIYSFSNNAIKKEGSTTSNYHSIRPFHD